MAILKIRDAEGNVQEVTAIKGDSYILTEKDKQDIAEMVAASNGVLTEERVLELIQANMPASAEGVDY